MVFLGMRLKAIILRADGVLVDTDEIFRSALHSVFEEAGFDKPALIGLPSFGISTPEIDTYILNRVKAWRRSEDATLLAKAVHRRSLKLFQKLISERNFRLRPGIEELVANALHHGIRIGLISDLPEAQTLTMVSAIPALAGNSNVVVMASGVAPIDTTVPVRTYAQALSSLSCDASECLLFEASGRGLEAARELGVATVVVRSCCAGEHVVGDALAVVDELSEIAISSYGSLTPLEKPKEILKDRWIEAVQALHAKAGRWLETGEGGVVMRVSDILKEKGSEVKTIKPAELIQTFARRLSNDKVGAMVVLGQQDSIEGIISERDLARGLAEHGSELSAMRVTDLMTKVVITCAAEDSILGVANVMTRRRIRHLPVTEKGKLVGLISIGDVLKFRLEELQLEANILRDYTIALR